MCRLGVFPPLFPRKLAEKVLDKMEKGNDDGTGSVFAREGNLVVHKWPISYPSVIKGGLRLLHHLPHSGWTVSHLRAASCGEVSLNNTHPFVKGRWAVAHNGSWSMYRFVEKMFPEIRWEGETDSEKAAYMLQRMGPDNFWELLKESPGTSGVFVAINRGGEAWIIKDGWSLYETPTSWGPLFTTERVDKTSHEIDSGIYAYSQDGKNIKSVSRWEKLGGRGGGHKFRQDDEDYCGYPGYAHLPKNTVQTSTSDKGGDLQHQRASGVERPVQKVIKVKGKYYYEYKGQSGLACLSEFPPCVPPGSDSSDDTGKENFSEKEYINQKFGDVSDEEFQKRQAAYLRGT